MNNSHCSWCFAREIRTRQIRVAGDDIILILGEIVDDLIRQMQRIFDNLWRRQAQPLSDRDI